MSSNTAQTETVVDGGRLRLSECYRFFVPLVLMVELNMISKSAIHAFLARTDTPSTTLAAFNSAFTFYFAIASATEITAVLSLSYLKARADVGRLLAFMALLLAVPLAITFAVAFTDAGRVLFSDWFSLSADARMQAQAAVALMALSAPVLILRGIAFALLMMERRTIIITASTFVRLASLVGSLLILPLWLEGAAIGAGALVTCMAVETAFAWLFAWPAFLRLPAVRDARDTVGAYWRFSWPLIINGSAEFGVILVITLFLGRLSQAELAIASFGVVHGLISLLIAPMRNLTQSAQALVSRREDVRVITVFTVQLVVFFSLLVSVLFLTPLRGWVLSDAMGLTGDLAAMSEPALAAGFAMVTFWACAALFRGLLAKARTTRSLAVGGLMRIATAGVVGALVLAYPNVNGPLLGIIAWIVSYAVETAISAWRLHRLGWYVQT
jgi:Na+-driven multidrug efflux pump